MRISDLVNKVEPFRFEFDGFVLEGQWYKYRTTTAAYSEKFEALPDIPENATEEEKIQAITAQLKAGRSFLHQALADAIKSWNAVDDNGPVEPTAEIFRELPEPFISKLAELFKGLRDGSANPTLAGSSST